MIRVLRAASCSAVKARAQAAKRLKALLVTAPKNLRTDPRMLSAAKLVRRAAGFRPGGLPDDVASATKFALGSIARRYKPSRRRSAGSTAISRGSCPRRRRVWSPSMASA